MLSVKKIVVFNYCLIFFGIFLLITTKDSYAIPQHTSYVIMDYNSGNILSGSYQDTRMYPASLTKMMTLYILFEQIQAGKIKLTDKFKISRKAASMPPSKLWLKPGRYITVKDAINAMIIKSANDAAYVVAENVGKTEPNFVKMMNATAKKMGLKNTRFANPNGLTAPHEYSTANDLAILARNLITRFNDYYYLFAQTSFSWNNYSYRSTNHLLGYSNVDGLKTGYTSASGFNLATSADVNGVRIIAVTLGHSSSSSRDNFMKQLVNNGIIIAQNLRLQYIAYKDPPSQILAANTLLNNVPNKTNNNISVADLINNNANTHIAEQLTNNSSNKTPHTSNEAKLKAVSDDDRNNTKITPASYETELTPNKNTPTNKAAADYLTNKISYYLQLGVFSSSTAAERVAKKALNKEPLLKKASITIATISHKNNNDLFRVRLYGLSKNDAALACKNLQNHKQSCFIREE